MSMYYILSSIYLFLFLSAISFNIKWKRILPIMLSIGMKTSFPVTGPFMKQAKRGSCLLPMLRPG